MMLRKKRFKTVRMRKAQAKSKTEQNRQRWERLTRKALAGDNDDMTLKQRLQASLEIEQAKKGKRK